MLKIHQIYNPKHSKYNYYKYIKLNTSCFYSILKKLIENYNLQSSYQEFIEIFKSIQKSLKDDLVDYNFSSTKVENRMYFSYFQFTKDEIKSKGLNFQVIFNYRDFSFELWLSGYNRKIQERYYKILKENLKIEYIGFSKDPSRDDFILKTTIPWEIKVGNTQELLKHIEKRLRQIENELLNY